MATSENLEQTNLPGRTNIAVQTRCWYFLNRNALMTAKERYEEELRRTGLNRKQWYNEVYLKSDHWKELRSRKYAEVGRQCERCRKPHRKRLEVHHDEYLDFFDVRTCDLRVLCDLCHEEVHREIAKSKNRPEKKKENLRDDFLAPASGEYRPRSLRMQELAGSGRRGSRMPKKRKRAAKNKGWKGFKAK